MNLELDPDLVAAMRALAEANQRAFREEVSHALRRHLAAPPRVTIQVNVEEPPLPEE